MIKIKTIYQGSIVDLSLEQVKLPDGRNHPIEFVSHPGGAAVVAINRDAKICLIRQYRPVFEKWVWEIPAGKIEHKEDPLITAKRELKEETGIDATTWVSLGSIYSVPGFCNEIIHIYLAQSLTIGEPNTDDHELIEVHWKTQQELMSGINSNKICDAKTVVGLFKAFNYLTNS